MQPNIINAALLAMWMFATSCGQKPVEQSPEPPAGEEMHRFIQLTPGQFAQADIETSGFSSRLMQEYLPASAELFLGTEHTASVSTITEGIVSELKVSLNQSVRKGDVVAVLLKPDLLDWQREYLEQKDRIVFLKAEFERYKMLSSENATAAKNYQKAEADLREAQTSLALQAAKLRQYQIEPDRLDAANLKTQLVLRAPISGTITQVHAGIGASLTPGTSLCEMADFSKIQPLVYVFEKDIFRVNPGAKVLLHFISDPSRTFSATITSMEGEVDRTRKARRAFARFDQPVSGLVAGAYMEARIAPAAGSETTVLPQAAVVREGDGEYIFILQVEEASRYIFHKVAVRSGSSDGGFVAVFPLETVPEGAKIVVKGAYYISAQGSGVEVEE